MVELGTKRISLILVQAHIMFRKRGLRNKISIAILINDEWII